MNRLAPVLTLVVLAASNVDAEQTVRTQRKTDREPLRYLLYVPKTDGGERLPLVLFLHGGGEGGDWIERVKKHGLPKLIDEGKSFPFIVVSPQNPSETQFWDDQQLLSLIDELQAEFPVDASRIYLTGLSRGGFGAWRLAIQNPERFAALVPICGGGPAPYVKRLKNVPTWVFHGAKDRVIPLEESQRMVDALRLAGGNVRFTIYPEADHDAWTETYNNPELYEWLLKQQRVSRAAAEKRPLALQFGRPVSVNEVAGLREAAFYPNHTLTLSFHGPNTSEADAVNPFTEYRLLVTFHHEHESIAVRGFYAADGNAAHSHATSGNVWQVRFAPPAAGTWSYSAELRRGTDIAVSDDASIGTVVPLQNATGNLEVSALPERPAGTRDLRKMPGRLCTDKQHFRFVQMDLLC